MIVAVKNPGEEIAYKVVPEISLKLLQELVGGYIETIATTQLARNKIVMIVNEEGKLKWLKSNFWVRGDLIVGPAVFVGRKRDEFVSLSEEQVKHLNQQFVENFKIYREGWLEVR